VALLALLADLTDDGSVGLIPIVTLRHAEGEERFLVI
jgi:hypothetical protein